MAYNGQSYQDPYMLSDICDYISDAPHQNSYKSNTDVTVLRVISPLLRIQMKKFVHKSIWVF